MKQYKDSKYNRITCEQCNGMRWNPDNVFFDCPTCGGFGFTLEKKTTNQTTENKTVVRPCQD